MLLRQPGYAAVCGRVSTVSSDGIVNAYQFRLYDSGRWELLGAAKDAVLASGEAASARDVWRHLELVMQGDRISASIDGAEQAAVTDARNSTGLAGLGADWSAAEFDNLAAVPIAAEVPVITLPPDVGATAPPPAPELLVPVAGDHAVRMSWKAAPAATGYRVRFGTREDKLEQSVDVGNVLTFTLRTLTNGTKYYFGVAALNARGEGKPASTQYATPGPPDVAR